MKKNGFSLIELAIVLIIVALLIGGILVGKSMMNTARLQSIITDWQKYTSAANSYFSKYNYWPGDDFDAATKWTGATAGNGDGGLGDPSSSTAEYFSFWQDLDSAHANMIPGTYSGSSGTSPFLPKTQIPNVYITHFYDDGTSTVCTACGGSVTNQAFYVTGATTPGYAKTSTTFSGPAPMLSGIDAGSLDSKIDDGTSGSGNVIGNSTTQGGCNYSLTTANSCTVYFIYKK